MNSPLLTTDHSESYALKEVAYQVWDDPADQVLSYLADAWKAMDALEASLPPDLQRWDAESLMTAQKGTQRARLALCNLNRSLRARRGRS